MFRKITSIILAITLCNTTSTYAYASPFAISFQDPVVLPSEIPQVKGLKRGETAPFDGILLNSRAAAEVQANTEQSEARCQIKIDKEVSLVKADLQYKLDVSIAKELASTEKNKLLENINKQQRELYTTELKNTQKLINKRDWGALYFAGGVIGGMLIILAGAYAVKEIRESP